MTDFDSLLPLFASRLGAVLSKIFKLRLASIIRAATPWQAFLTNNIDMSSTESSGAPAEATATTPASSAAATFGSTRGSGLARGKRPTNSPVTAATPVSTEYTPTAIEVVSAPREYQNPFAPAETPAAARPEPVVSATPTPAAFVSPVQENSTPIEKNAPTFDEPAELSILEPELQKTAPAQTWESEGFRPTREPRNDRSRREESHRDEPRREERAERAPRQESAPFDPASIPEKFLYVRPGYNYVPTPSNYGGAPRENREHRPASSEPYSAPATAPAKSRGFLGWLKSLFGGSSAESVAPASSNGDHRRDGGQRRHRGGRNRGGHGGDRAGNPGGGEGGQHRSRGGRGRSGGGYRGERFGGAQGGDSTG